MMVPPRSAFRNKPEAVGIDELFSVKQLAERFGVTTRSVERYVAGGELPELRKIFGERYFRRPQIEEWLGRMFLGRQ